MDVRPVRTDEDHSSALREIEALWGADEGTPEGDRLDVLATLVHAYEERRWPVDELDPIQAIEAAMTHEGYSRSDLAKVIGQSRTTEILQRKRPLTLPMIRKIAAAWHVPERVLVKEYKLATAANGQQAGAAARRHAAGGGSGLPATAAPRRRLG